MDQVLSIKNLTFGYSKQKLLYQDFNLTLKKGEIKSIVGESGIGKTTLFELILKNISPHKGVINVTSKIAQVFQDPYTSFHPSYTILSQIKDVASLEQLDILVEKINLDKTILNTLPHQLSGGQLQRASILRALLMKPDLLLLDEPTSALDNVIQLEVMKIIVESLQDVAILIITHDEELALWCADEIVKIG